MRRLLAFITALTLVLGITGVALGAAARKTTGKVYAGVTHAEGKNLYVSGDFKDSLLGRGAIVYITRVGPSAKQGTFLIKARTITVYTKKGSLTGTGSAEQTVAPGGKTSVENGKFALTKGTGAYRGHTFRGTFSGPYNDGVYEFNYKATYR